MIVVSDTSCITGLIAIHREQLLRQLFGTVIIPPAVSEELRAAHAILPDYLETRTPLGTAAVARLLLKPLDLGEAEAMVLAEELHADYLLIDETAGRKVAEARGIRHFGLLGVLSRAKEKGFISQLRPELDALISTGFRIAPRLRERFLSDMGEA